MSSCQNCGAPVTVALDSPVRCSFCHAVIAPPAKESVVPVPVQVVNQVVQMMGGPAAANALEPRCPHCRRKLADVRVAGVDLHGCGACGGIWVDNSGAQHVVKYHEAVFAELAERAARNAQHVGQRAEAPVCAVCPAPLDRATAANIELDICPEHGTWFDAWELARLVHALGEPKAKTTSEPRWVADAPKRRVDLVPCVGCGQTIGRAVANISPSGPKCDTCWRAEQDREAGISRTTATSILPSAVSGVDVAVTGMGLLFDVLSAITDT